MTDRPGARLVGFVLDAPNPRELAVFYRELMRASIGTALVKARRAVHARRSPDWADYVHYGDAEFRLKLP